MQFQGHAHTCTHPYNEIIGIYGFIGATWLIKVTQPSTTVVFSHAHM